MSVSLSTKEKGSVFIELVLHFILFKELDTAPLPKVARLLDCPLQSSWIWCDPSMYQCTAYYVWSVQSVSLRFLVPFKYFKTCFTFSQSSSSGDCTLVVRKDTAVWISQCAQFAAKSSWYTVWWKASAISSSSLRPSSLTLKRWSPAGVADFPIIFSGNSLIILEMYRFMLICTSFFDEKLKIIPR